MATTKSPADLTITPRDRRFGRGTAHARWWMGGDPVATAFYNALSATFPLGEAYFVESVKAFRDDAPPKLAAEIRAFVAQEVAHSREHLAFNRRAVESGYDLSRIEAGVAQSLALTKGRPPILDLAVTMALEHYTAIMAQRMLSDPHAFAAADPEQQALWRWHAIEEIEHKGVAYDTWLHATRDWSRGKRWRVKALLMLLTSRNFWKNRYANMLDLLAQDGITGARAHARILWFLFGNPGALRTLFFPWLAFFLPGFHPWNHDDRDLIARADLDPLLPGAQAA
ncbi:metal-dependent hydrolase [Sandaracinobacteroides saxicola]|uniref:Metal-dependent hydrolase n=1 Tax=Sandaracinobacteroides saxicola TaxID=2759707 RepID=A0A7G5IK64_9SPHN|nr:metal-dependent hydrolase [Sandaracinobacteroides saxicola]QMW23756.1 metal-dependent hydrolase [Sandaracinobacteroides saxicola]